MPPAPHPIFPDWPSCPADLVPLPQVEGPKLKPFDFGGPQRIEFVKYIASGLHGHAVHARIHGKDYAIKLVRPYFLISPYFQTSFLALTCQFRYVSVLSWYGPLECYYPESDHKEPLMALAPYSEPFYTECRAFGRLHETGRADLALDCFGYVLLDEDSERALNNLKLLEFNGDDHYTVGDVRSDFRGPSGRPPPIRGIVKALGTPDNTTDNLPVATARRLLDDIMQMQQLGIVRLDGRRDQFIDWKFADFSTALTTPHFLMTPEILKGPIPPSGLAAMEEQLFLMCLADYDEFEGALRNSNDFKRTDQRKRLNLFILTGRIRYPLRRTARHRNVLYTLVDPRQFDWRAPMAAAAAAGLAKRPTESARARAARLPRWYYPGPKDLVYYFRRMDSYPMIIEWIVRDGCILPIKRGMGAVCHDLNMLLQKSGGHLDLAVPENKLLVEEDKNARFMLDETYVSYCSYF